MPQDRESGSAAVEYGLKTAKIIAQKLGATKEGPSNSNEYLFNGRHIVIKSARHKPGKIGVSYKMLEKLDAILGAFETDSGTYKVYELSPAQFKKNEQPTKSKGASKGRVGVVEQSIFYRKGTFLKELYF